MLTFLKADQFAPFIHEVFGKRVVRVKRLKGGLLNQNIRLDTKNEFFVLKIYRPEVDSERLVETHRLLRFVSRHHIPVALPIAAKEIHGHQAAIYPFLSGKHPRKQKNSRKNLFLMGEMLGRIHSVLEQFTPKKIKQARVDMSKAKILNGFEQIDELLGQASKGDRAFLLPMVKFQKLLMAKDHFDPSQLKKLPLYFCHGDFHAANILMDGGRIVAVLDWEKADWLWRPLELMRSLLFNTRTRDGEYSLDGMQAFILGYKRHITLTPLEKKWMFDIGFRKYTYDTWAMRQFLGGQRALRANIKRRFIGSKMLWSKQSLYKRKILEFLG